MSSNKKRSERVEELLRWAEATEYYAANGSFGYMHEDGVFPVKDIRVMFQDYKAKPYEQIGSSKDFIPNLSVLDMLLNIGPERTKKYIEEGTEEWKTWEEKLVAIGGR